MPRKLKVTVHVGGRVFRPGDDVPDEYARMITNHSVWQRAEAPARQLQPPAQDVPQSQENPPTKEVQPAQRSYVYPGKAAKTRGASGALADAGNH